MRCLYCGKQLALFKKLTGGGEFCSDAHKHAYHEEYNKLALSRLMEAQTRQEEHAPHPSAEAPPATRTGTPSNPVIPEPEFHGGYFKPTLSPRDVAAPFMDISRQQAVNQPIRPSADSEGAIFDIQAAPEPPRSSVIIDLQPAVDGAPKSATLASLVPAWPLEIPVGVQIATRPELSLGGVIVKNQPVSGAAAIAALTATPAGMTLALPSSPQISFEARVPEARVIVQIRAVAGSTVAAAATQTPAAMAPAIPCSDASQPLPQLAEAGMVIDRHPTAGTSVPAQWEFVQPTFDLQCALPEQPLKVQTTGIPAIPGNVPIETEPAGDREPEPMAEEAASFQRGIELPRNFEPGWAAGLDFARAEEEVAELSLRSRDWSPCEAAGQCSVAPAVAPEPDAPETDAPETAVMVEPGPVQGATVQASVREVSPLPGILPTLTPEPVIDDALLSSLFEGRETPANPDPQEALPAPPPESRATAHANHDGHETQIVNGPVSFVPVTIRPAGAPTKSRLMQSFQAIAMVNANPQIPVWNTLPLRPRMMLGRPPGPGASLLDRARPDPGARSEARKPATPAVALDDRPDSASDDAVPTFGSVTKPRSGLSRWFKLGILAGILGIAGSSNWVDRGSGPHRISFAEVRHDMTTESAVCRK